ncbi:MAG: NUDIX domain-containing protein [Alphaproteobacteria bacterium]
MNKNIINVVECAIEYNNKLLIIKRPLNVHAAGVLAFPGGKVEEEDLLNRYDVLRAAVKREIFEEVGLDLEDQIDYITTNYFVDDYGNNILDSLFYCKLEKTYLNIVASEREVVEYYWMGMEEIMNNVNSPDWLKEYVKLIEKKYPCNNEVYS